MDDDNGKRTVVPHCHTNEAHKTLGVMLAPEDNNESQVAMMRKIASQFGDSIRTGFIKGHDVMHALLTTVMRSLTGHYPPLRSAKLIAHILWHRSSRTPSQKYKSSVLYNEMLSMALYIYRVWVSKTCTPR